MEDAYHLARFMSRHYGYPSVDGGTIAAASGITSTTSTATATTGTSTATSTASPDAVRILTDEKKHRGTVRYPTRDNILQAMRWLVAGSRAGDRLFLSYSGHGGLKPNTGGYAHPCIPLIHASLIITTNP